MRKRLILIMLLIIVILTPFIIAANIAVNNPQPATFGWIVNATSTDLTTLQQLRGITASQTLFMRDIAIRTTEPASITIGYSDGAVGTPTLGPIFLGSSTGWSEFSKVFLVPIRLPMGASLTALSDRAVSVYIYVLGYTEE